MGIGNRYHLFRLPQSVERAIAGIISTHEFSEQAASLIAGGDSQLMQELAAIVSGQIETGDGPINLGPVAR